jgi:hypothetical protein
MLHGAVGTDDRQASFPCRKIESLIPQNLHLLAD